MFQLGAKRLVVLGLFAGFLVGCGGGGDGGSSSSGNVNPTDTTTTTGGTGSGTDTGSGGTTSTTTQFNVSQVLSNAYTTAATYTLSGTNSKGSILLSYKIEPQADVSFQGSMVKRVKRTLTPTLNGVAQPVESGTFLFQVNPFIFKSVNEVELNTATKPENTSFESKFSSAPSSVVIGGSGELGQNTQVIKWTSSTLTWLDQFRYSVEAATSAGTAWVCVVGTLYENGVLNSEDKECFLSNANSDILGVKLEFKEFDAAGAVINPFTLR